MIGALAGKRVLHVFAHCDDEIVCGWPVFQDPAIDRSLLIVSSDRKTAKRQWCSHRGFVTLDLCKLLSVEARVLDYDSEFYRLNHRNGELAAFENHVLAEIGKFEFDFIMTHNPFGEYGHLDHRFLFDLLSRSMACPILITDIFMPSDWTDQPPVAARRREAFYRSKVADVDLDEAFYRRVEQFYETRRVWTWSVPPARQASLYQI